MGWEAHIVRLRAVVAGAVTVTLLAAGSAAAGTLTLNADPAAGSGCGLFQVNGDVSRFSHSCDGIAGDNAQISSFGSGLPAGSRIGYQINAPAGITINAAYVGANAITNINNGAGWGGGGYWSGGGDAWVGGQTSESDGLFNSSYWGFQMICGASSCSNPGGISVNTVQLTATENQGPTLTAVGANNLWYETSHYVWNPAGDAWPITLAASDPSGACRTWAYVDGRLVSGPSATPNTSQWQQCPDSTWMPAEGASVDTRTYVPHSGALSLQLDASNAAGVDSAVSETLQVDNEPVQLNLSGPTAASTSDGTQYVNASATAGPSGVTIGCSLDGGATQWQSGTSEQVPVAGIGQHSISCQARNGAIDPQGQYAYSPVENWTLNIGQPTVSAVGFSKIVNHLRCRRERKRVRIPAHVVTIHRHHKTIHRHVRARIKVRTVERCHPRVVWRRRAVWVTIRRHGKRVRVKRMRRVRVVLLPHTVTETTKRVGYGRASTLGGWLGTSTGIALPGQTVEILAAADNGKGNFRAIATATTGATGAWNAQLPPGPSRVIEAAYGGSATLLPTTSAPVTTIVPAHVTMKITPRTVPWGATIRITGRVHGGYVPTHSNLLRLNVGIGRIGQLVGLPKIRPTGRFVIVWKFNPGRGIIHPWFSVGTLAEAAFPYGPGASKRVSVTLGKPTPHHKRRHKHKRRTKRKRR
jgi:hypothetical protein